MKHTLIGITPHGYAIRRVGRGKFKAGCRGPWTLAECEAHWLRPWYPDAERGQNIMAQIRRNRKLTLTQCDALIRTIGNPGWRACAVRECHATLGAKRTDALIRTVGDDYRRAWAVRECRETLGPKRCEALRAL